MTNLVTNVESVVAEHAEEPAVVYEDHEFSYGEFWAQTGQFAAALREGGAEPGDRVAIYLPNLPQFVVAFHGALRAGCVIVPMNPQYKSREISHLLGDSGATTVVALLDLVPFVQQVRDDTDVETVVTVGGEADAGTPFREFLVADGDDSVAERADDDVAVQPYTSGTTGQPKGVQLTHHNLASNARQSMDIMPGGLKPSDRKIGVLPLFHIYGMTVGMNATLFAGGTFYPMAAWDAQDAMALVEDAELTLFDGVPAMYNDIVNQPNAEEFDLSSVRMCTVGGSGIPIEVLRTFEDLYDVEIYEGYGLTETSPVTHFNSPKWGRRVGSIGKPLDGVDAKVITGDFEEVDPVAEGPLDEDEVDMDEVTGELVVAGPNVMKGYAGLPEANREAFTEREGSPGSEATGTSEDSSSGKKWFHTGDLGYHDEDGYFYVVDRKKHMINTAGYNVYPREVEELLFEHDAVADVAVVGIPDDRRGETVKAFVVKTPDGDATADELKQFCLDRLAEYKHPREVEFVEELPRTTTGKVKKFELVEG
ncbi:long-chain-fatty-acid--CoA ligase [Halobacterium litoreum]|uniref:Long-chain fatty acid--CoA ligase n=1 Tax=Halobacterium litoreum TaxID=2039234 RepID=A0ABD5NBQ7_9EURY|nr:long-chain fatty acid--CoA ligase [Halobacterium litoreum]UHH14576.1 long-chain fatty acid--CoA ligase [Halobacterium litoreum]